MRVKEWFCITMIEDVRAMRNEIIRNTTGTYPGIWLRVFLGVFIPRAAPPDLLQHTSIQLPQPSTIRTLGEVEGKLEMDI